MNCLPDMPLPRGTITMLRPPEGSGFRGWLLDLDLLPEMPLENAILVTNSEVADKSPRRIGSGARDSRLAIAGRASDVEITTSISQDDNVSINNPAKASPEPSNFHAWWIMAMSAVLLVWLIFEAFS